MQGPRSKVKGSKKVPVTKSQVLTCENGRLVRGIPIAAQPTHVPVPLTATPVQAQNATVTVQVPKDGAVKVNEADVFVYFFLPALGNKVLVSPERQEDVGVQSDVIRRLQTPELLLAVDVGLAVLEHRNVLYLGEVQFGECDGTGVRLIVEDSQTLVNELGGIESAASDGREQVQRLTDSDGFSHCLSPCVPESD